MRSVITILLALALFASISSTPRTQGAQGQDRPDLSDQGKPVGRVTDSYREAQVGEVSSTAGQSGKHPAWVEEARERAFAHLKQHGRKQAEGLHAAAADLFLLSADRDDLGQIHVRLAQSHNGVPVFGGQVIVQLDDKSVRETWGEVFKESSIDTTPVLTSSQAIDAAVAALGYAGEFAYKPEAKLMILPHKIIDPDSSTSSATLVYQIELLIEDGTDATARHQYFVNAKDGSIVWHYDSLHRQSVMGSGHSLYAGTLSISTNNAAGTFFLQDVGRGNMKTSDMQNQESASDGNTFTNASNIWGNGTIYNRESAGVDAHFGAMKTWDYFLDRHGRRGIDGNGYQMISRVHYGNNINNAFWDGTRVTYGDGDGSTYGPFVAIDVIAHEITHGLTEKTARLIYEKESGAVNESFSDIFGTAVEFYANVNPDYLIGEDIYTPGIAGDAMRSMADPSSRGQAAHYYARKYPGSCTPNNNPKDPNYNDNCGVHANSGIQNRAFYLLAQGYTHPLHPDHPDYSMRGISREAAERIFYRALTLKIAKIRADFHDVRVATLQAAADLYGVGSLQYNSTATAWNFVGVIGPVKLQSRSIPEVMSTGQRYACSITVRNTSDQTWSAIEGYKLGLKQPNDNTWGIRHVDLPHIVRPGEEVTFNFAVTAPSAKEWHPTAIYNYPSFEWGMMRGSEWYGTPFQSSIRVERQLLQTKHVTVRESDRDVDTGIDVRAGDKLVFSAYGQIWAGVWFTGTNGPEGWSGWSAGRTSPMPEANAFSLLGKLDAGYFYIGKGEYYRQSYRGPDSRLILRINDNRPGNGSGSFTCKIMHWR